MRHEHPTRWSRLLTSLALVLALGGISGLTGCGSEDSVSLPGITQPPPDDGGGTQPPPAGQPQVALASPNPTAITAGAAGSVIAATVRDADGAPVAGQSVAFTASPSTVGQLSAATAVTNASGVAQVTVTGLRAGTLSVTARALGVTSAPVAVTVLAPLVTVALSPADGRISASRPDGAGATVTFTVTDQDGTPLAGQTVSFATTLGVLDAAGRNTDADGKASVKVTSEAAGQAGVTASVLGVSTAAAVVTVLPSALQVPVTVTTSANKIPTNGTATITIRATDEFGNPVNEAFDVAAVLLGTTASTGNLSPASVQLANGQGTAIFTPTEQGVARIRVSRQGAQVGAVDVSVELVLAGEPARIEFTVDPAEIAVQGGGGTQSSAIQIRVLDVLGNPIQDGLAPNNLQVEILQGPNGGESLDGLARLRQVRTLSTSGGQARVELQSGVRPGTVLVEVRVTKDSLGRDLTVPLQATVPQITIRSGPPASLFLTPSNAIQSPGLRGNGSITHDYLAFVSDLWGNAVPEGTIVFFSQFLNIKRECRNRQVFDPLNPAAVNGFIAETCVGAAAGSIAPSTNPLDPRATFVSGSVPFDGVLAGDTLVVITEDNPNGYGGYRVSQVLDAFTLRLDGDVAVGASGLEWAVGNNANLGGGVFTTEGEAATVGGVARWSNTYAGELVNSPAYIFAEAEGGAQGHGRFFRLAWRADTTIEQLAGPQDGDRVGATATQFFAFFFEDSSPPTPYAIPGLRTSVAATDGDLEVVAGSIAFEDPTTGTLTLETSPRVISTGDPGGVIAFQWSPPDPVAVGQEFTLVVAGGGAIRRIKLTIQ
ncbi:MAG: Ig-like domain-containing protein [Thermodesulfobacteriota bacterium]